MSTTQAPPADAVRGRRRFRVVAVDQRRERAEPTAPQAKAEAASKKEMVVAPTQAWCGRSSKSTGLAQIWANFRTLIRILSQNVGSTCQIWANPVSFAFRVRSRYRVARPSSIHFTPWLRRGSVLVPLSLKRQCIRNAIRTLGMTCGPTPSRTHGPGRWRRRGRGRYSS